MNLFEDYAFIEKGKKRKQMLKELAIPKRHCELKKALHLHGNCITRILRDFFSRKLIDTQWDGPQIIRYKLTEKGERLRLLVINLENKKGRDRNLG